jgi:hypothetical protein
MPLTPAAIQNAIQAAAPDLKGTVWLQLTAALGIAIATWALTPANVVVLGVSSGAIGTGTVIGKLFVAPQPLPVTTASAAAGLLGVQAPLVARAVGFGVAAAFNASASYQGISAGVGVGADTVASVQANPAALTNLIMQVAGGSGLQGVRMPEIASALGTGIATLLSTSTTGFGVVTGPAGPLPSGGTSISRVT